ncbi:hypothetical protein ACFV1T_34720, partial [Streptomyces vinaceus]
PQQGGGGRPRGHARGQPGGCGDDLRGAAARGARGHLHAEPGDRVATRLDNSASVGFVYAHGADAAAALATVRAAAARIRIDTRKEGRR